MASRRDAIAPTVDRILGAVKEAGLSAERRIDLAVATAEALSNAAVHGNKLGPGSQVAITVRVVPGREATHRGEGLGRRLRLTRPSTIPPIPRTSSRPGGRGVFLMRRLVDRLEIEPPGNRVRLTMREAPLERVRRSHRRAFKPLDRPGLAESVRLSRGHPASDGNRDHPASAASHDSDIVALRFGPFELDLRSGEMRRARSARAAAAPAVQGARPARRPAGRAGHARGDPEGGLARRDLRRLRAVAELLHPADPQRPRRLRALSALRGDAAAARLPLQLRPGGDRCGRRARSWSGAGRGPLLAHEPAEEVAPEHVLPASPRVGRGDSLAVGRRSRWSALALAAVALSFFLAPRPRRPESTRSIPPAHLPPRLRGVRALRHRRAGGVRRRLRRRARRLLPLARRDARDRGRSRRGDPARGSLAPGRGGVPAQGRPWRARPSPAGPPRRSWSACDRRTGARTAPTSWSCAGEQSPSKIEFPVGTVLCEAVWPSHLRISPDGQHVAFLEHPLAGDDRGPGGGGGPQGEAHDAHRGLRERVGPGLVAARATRSASPRPRWEPTPRSTRCALDGRVRTVLPAMGRLVLHDISPEGRLLIERTTLRHEIRFRRLAREGGPRPVLAGPLRRWPISRPTAKPSSSTRAARAAAPSTRSSSARPTARSRSAWVPAAPSASPRTGSGRSPSPSSTAAASTSCPRGPERSARSATPGSSQYDSAGFVGDGQTIFFTERRTGRQGRARFSRTSRAARPRPALPEGVWLGRNNFSPDGRPPRPPLPRGARRPLHLPGGRRGRAAAGAGPGAGSASGGMGRRGPAVRAPGGPVPEEHVSRVDPTTGRAEPWAELRPARHRRRGGHGPHRGRRAAATPIAYSYTRRLADLYVVEGVR